VQHYANNLKNCALFKAESESAFNISDEQTLKAAAESDAGLQYVFVTGICKWLLGMAVRQEPPSTIEVKSVLGYHVEKSASVVDLVSIAIRFKPEHAPANDPVNLAKVVKKVPDECALAVKALKRVARLGDVDGILKNNPEVEKSMLQRMTDLLAAARYDVEAYSEWLAAKA
jgi:hypothetical protein